MVISHISPTCYLLSGDAFNPLPNIQILDLTNFKTFTRDKSNVALMMVSVFYKAKKHCGKWSKCWLPAFPPFPTFFFKSLIYQGCLKSGLCGKKLI